MKNILRKGQKGPNRRGKKGKGQKVVRPTGGGGGGGGCPPAPPADPVVKVIWAPKTKLNRTLFINDKKSISIHDSKLTLDYGGSISVKQDQAETLKILKDNIKYTIRGIGNVKIVRKGVGQPDTRLDVGATFTHKEMMEGKSIKFSLEGNKKDGTLELELNGQNAKFEVRIMKNNDRDMPGYGAPR